MKQLLFLFVLILLPQAAQAGSVGVIPSRKPIPNRYIAQFISDSGISARSAADLMARTHAIRVTAVYENTIQGIATVGASTVADARWQYSNYRVSLYAPGQYVESAGTRPNGSGYDNRSQESLCADSTKYPQDTCTSGTSFATPLVAGVVARYLQSNPTHNRDQVLSFLQSEAASGNGVSIQDAAGTANLLNMSDCN